jgi:hypothetical protein
MNRMSGLKKLAAVCGLSLCIGSALADPLVAGARIAKILNVRNVGDSSFVLQTEGGTGICNSWIYFYPTSTSTAALEAQKRAYAAALMAMSTGMRVDIESVDATCSGAYAIFIYP